LWSEFRSYRRPCKLNGIVKANAQSFFHPHVPTLLSPHKTVSKVGKFKLEIAKNFKKEIYENVPTSLCKIADSSKTAHRIASLMIALITRPKLTQCAKI